MKTSVLSACLKSLSACICVGLKTFHFNSFHMSWDWEQDICLVVMTSCQTDVFKAFLCVDSSLGGAADDVPLSWIQPRGIVLVVELSKCGNTGGNWKLLAEGETSSWCTLTCPDLRDGWKLTWPCDLSTWQSLSYVTVLSKVCQQQQVRVLTVNCRQWSLSVLNRPVLRVTCWRGVRRRSEFFFFKTH